MKKIKKVIVFLLLLTNSCAVFLNTKNDEKLQFPVETDFPGWELVTNFKKNVIFEEKNSEDELYIKYKAVAKYKGVFNSFDVDKEIKLEISFVEFEDSNFPYSLFTNVKNYKPSEIENKIIFYRKKNMIISGFDKYFVKCEIFGKLNAMPEIEKRIILKNAIKTSIQIISGKSEGNVEKWNIFGKQKRLFVNKDKNDDNFVIFHEKINGINGLRKVISQKLSLKEKSYKFFYSDFLNENEAFKIYNKFLESNKKVILGKFNGIQFIVKKNKDGDYALISYYKKWIYGVYELKNIKDGFAALFEIKKNIIKREGVK